MERRMLKTPRAILENPSNSLHVLPGYRMLYGTPPIWTSLCRGCRLKCWKLGALSLVRGQDGACSNNLDLSLFAPDLLSLNLRTEEFSTFPVQPSPCSETRSCPSSLLGPHQWSRLKRTAIVRLEKANGRRCTFHHALTQHMEAGWWPDAAQLVGSNTGVNTIVLWGCAYNTQCGFTCVTETDEIWQHIKNCFSSESASSCVSHL